jgi:hypothetical protein
VLFAKISLQNVPTIINGITASTSIIVGFSGAVIGIVIRELFQNDKKAREYFLGVLALFIYTFGFQFWVYSLLVSGAVDWALRWSLSGLLLSLLIFGLTIIVTSYRIEVQKKNIWKSMDY